MWLPEMATKLADLQSVIQKDILEDGEESLPHIKVPAGIAAKKRLAVYQNAYKLRLIEILGVNHDLLWTFMGDEAFWQMGDRYFDKCPSSHPNARWVAHRLPEFLTEDKNYAGMPVLTEIALIERAIEDSFDAADSAIATMDNLAAMDPEKIGGIKLEFSPAGFLIELKTNAYDIFLALKKEEAPPSPKAIDETAHVLVWRKDQQSMFRGVGAEEAMLYQEAQRGKDFASLCEMASVMDNPETAASRVAGYITEWLNAEVISRLHL